MWNSNMVYYGGSTNSHISHCRLVPSVASEKSPRKEYENDSIIDDKFCNCLHIALSGLKGSLEQLCKCTNKVWKVLCKHEVEALHVSGVYGVWLLVADNNVV